MMIDLAEVWVGDFWWRLRYVCFLSAAYILILGAFCIWIFKFPTDFK